MRLEDLTSDQLEKLHQRRCDWIVEKHEGPLHWSRVFEYRQLKFLRADGYDVLLPIDEDHHAHIEILRCIPSEGGDMLTIFLEDTTHWSGSWAGFMAVCERLPGEEFYVAIVYHEWFLVDCEWLTGS